MKHSKVTQCLSPQEVRDSLNEIEDFLIEHETKEKIKEADLDWIEVEMKRLRSFFV
jgi:hypothetical protein